MSKRFNEELALTAVSDNLQIGVGQIERVGADRCEDSAVDTRAEHVKVTFVWRNRLFQ